METLTNHSAAREKQTNTLADGQTDRWADGQAGQRETGNLNSFNLT